MSTDLSSLIAKLKKLPQHVAEEAAKHAAPRIHDAVKRNVRAQQDTTGKAWTPRSIKRKTDQGKPMLTGAGDALQVVVHGSSIILSLPFEPYGRQNVGAINNHVPTADNKPRSHKKHAKKHRIPREIIPNNKRFLPPEWRRIIHEEIDRAIAKELRAA